MSFERLPRVCVSSQSMAKVVLGQSTAAVVAPCRRRESLNCSINPPQQSPVKSCCQQKPGWVGSETGSSGRRAHSAGMPCGDRGRPGSGGESPADAGLLLLALELGGNLEAQVTFAPRCAFCDCLNQPLHTRCRLFLRWVARATMGRNHMRIRTKAFTNECARFCFGLTTEAESVRNPEKIC